MKLIIFYCTGLTLAWLGLNAVLVGVGNWSRDGALVPVLAGLMVLWLAVRALLATIRLYLPPKDQRDRLVG